MTETIALGSGSQIKLEALRLALSQLNLDWEITAAQVYSRAMLQPVSLSSTKNGAESRMNAVAEPCPHGTYLMGIENGLVVHNRDWFDVAVVAVRQKNVRRNFYALSQQVKVPLWAVKAVGERGFNKVTVGQVLHEHDSSIDPHNPHLHLAGISRITLLAEATVQALTQLREGLRPRGRYRYQPVLNKTVH